MEITVDLTRQNKFTAYFNELLYAAVADLERVRLDCGYDLSTYDPYAFHNLENVLRKPSDRIKGVRSVFTLPDDTRQMICILMAAFMDEIISVRDVPNIIAIDVRLGAAFEAARPGMSIVPFLVKIYEENQHALGQTLRSHVDPINLVSASIDAVFSTHYMQNPIMCTLYKMLFQGFMRSLAFKFAPIAWMGCRTMRIDINMFMGTLVGNGLQFRICDALCQLIVVKPKKARAPAKPRKPKAAVNIAEVTKEAAAAYDMSLRDELESDADMFTIKTNAPIRDVSDAYEEEYDENI
jgi:hypothetical protein